MTILHLSLRLATQSAAWATIMAASAGINLTMLHQPLELRTRAVLVFFWLGGFTAFGLTSSVMRQMPIGWRPGQRFSAALIMLGITTIGLTGLIFAMHFRLYFAQWHDDHLSMRFLFETVFTMLSAVYQFLVLGVRLYLPFGFIALLGASWAFAFKRI